MQKKINVLTVIAKYTTRSAASGSWPWHCVLSNGFVECRSRCNLLVTKCINFLYIYIYKNYIRHVKKIYLRTKNITNMYVLLRKCIVVSVDVVVYSLWRTVMAIEAMREFRFNRFSIWATSSPATKQCMYVVFILLISFWAIKSLILNFIKQSKQLPWKCQNLGNWSYFRGIYTTHALTYNYFNIWY